jgi:glutaminyl-tRNA synthetase
VSSSESARPLDFIRSIVDADVRAGKNGGRVVTRFPPEPNGFLHVGHAKAISVSFDIAREFGGRCHLRFDDTNPSKEEEAFVRAQQEDIRWLGYDWGEHLYYASDYFERLYEFAVELIRRGDAYVCDLSADQVREHRGTLTEPGRPSPWRERPVQESLDLFERMRRGEFDEGSRTLRAKIDMASPNLNMRDPVLYRIQDTAHHRTGERWCIYPMYDFAHPLSDAIEGITHSLCSLEYEDHRPLYDWVLEHTSSPCHPQQIEFARLALTHTVLSKRVLRRLVEEGLVRGWDDPRMPTLRGLRRRGYTPAAIRALCASVGVTKRATTIEIAQLEHAVREDLNLRAPRVMAVLRPLRVVIESFPEGEVEWLEAVNNPEDASMGTRRIPFSRELWIEQEDFREDPPKGYFRLSPGREVRMRYAYFVTCREVVKDPATGEVIEVRCTHDPATRGGDAPDGRRPKATLHWLSAPHALSAEVRLYDHLFSETHPEPDPERDLAAQISATSEQTLAACRVEPSLATASPGDRFQFERVGYFCADPDTRPGKPVFNRTVGLRDTWARAQKKGASG